MSERVSTEAGTERDRLAEDRALDLGGLVDRWRAHEMDHETLLREAARLLASPAPGMEALDTDGVVRCGCQWAHPANGEVLQEWPAEIDPHCPVHGVDMPDYAPRDTERLDWLEAQRVRALVPFMESSGWRLCEYTADGLVPVGPFRPTLREAIDATRTLETWTCGVPEGFSRVPPEARAEVRDYAEWLRLPKPRRDFYSWRRSCERWDCEGDHKRLAHDPVTGELAAEEAP